MAKPQLVALEDRSTPAAVGALDLTFNATGLIDVPFDQGATNTDLGAAVAVQADGKIVVVGSAQAGGADVDFAIARLNPDGTLDTTFGSNGVRTIGFDLGGSNIDVATSVAIDQLGRIVVGGYAQTDAATDYDFAVIRLTDAGDLDATFDTDGRQTVAFDVSGGSQDDKAAGVAVDSQNRIVLAGTVAQATAADTDFGVARLTAAGALDKTFGTSGRQTIAFDLGGANADTAAAVAIDSGDRVIVAGSVQVSNFGDTDFGVARLTAAGALDTTFDTNGTQTVEFDLGGSNADTAAAVALDGSGRIVVVGSVVVGTAGDVDIGVARFNAADGLLDTTFADGGKVSLGFDLGGTNQDKAAGVTINFRTGDIVVAATVDSATAGDTDFGVARLTSLGDLDPSFSTDGRAVVAFDRGGANADTAAGITQDARGRILVVGSVDTATANDRDFGVARLTATVGLANELLVGGTADGQAINYAPAATGFNKSGGAAAADLTSLVRPVTADLNGDGQPDQILGTGPGRVSAVRIQLAGQANGDVIITPSPIDFNPFETFTGGVFLAAGDIDGDGRDEFVVSPDVGGGPRASVYGLAADGVTLVKKADFFGIDDPNFRGGARVAVGDIDADGRADLVVGAGFLGGPRVAVFDGASLFTADRLKLVGDFFAFPGTDSQTLRNGVFVTVGDLDGDGFGDVIVGGGPGGGPRVFALSGQTLVNQSLDAAYAKPVANFFVANDANSRGGVRLAVKDLDGDDRADLITASGDGLPSRVRVYRGSTVPQANGVEPPLLQEFDPFGVTLANGVYVG